MSKASLLFILDHAKPAKDDCSIAIIQQPIHLKVNPRLQNRNQAPVSEQRPIHPPPVLKLVMGPKGPAQNPPTLSDLETLQVLSLLSNKTQLPEAAHYLTFFVSADITDLDGKPVDADPDTISGQKVSSGMYIKLPTDCRNKRPDYSVCFVFADLSVRRLGQFRLKFQLYEFKDYTIQLRDTTLSDVFTVYSQKKFPGLLPLSPLTQFLYKRGARIRLRRVKERHGSNPGLTSINKSPSPCSQSLQRPNMMLGSGNGQLTLNTPLSAPRSAPTSFMSRKRSFSSILETYPRRRLLYVLPVGTQHPLPIGLSLLPVLPVFPWRSHQEHQEHH